MRALEALRTRSVALVSVVLFAATVVANLVPDAVEQDALGFCGWLGVVTFALGMAAVFVTSVCVSWPAVFTAELGPMKIIEKHVDPHLTWPSADLYKKLATDLDGYANESKKTLRVRAQFYTAGIIAAGTAVVGFALILGRCHLLKLNPHDSPTGTATVTAQAKKKRAVAAGQPQRRRLQGGTSVVWAKPRYVAATLMAESTPENQPTAKPRSAAVQKSCTTVPDTSERRGACS